MFCQKCGKENKDGSKVCGFCGTPLMVASSQLQGYPSQQGQGYGYQNGNWQPPVKGGTGKATAALVVGILSLLFVIVGALGSVVTYGIFLPFFIFNVFFSIIGVILGSSGRKTAGKGRATTGLVMSIIALVLSCIVAIPVICIGGCGAAVCSTIK